MYRVHPFSQPMNQQWGDKLRRTTVKMSSTFRVFAFFYGSANFQHARY